MIFGYTSVVRSFVTLKDEVEMRQSPAFAPAGPQSIERLSTRRITWQPWERPRKRSVAVPFAGNDGLNSGIVIRVIPALSAEDWLAVTIEYRNDIDILNPFQQLDETS